MKLVIAFATFIAGAFKANNVVGNAVTKRPDYRLYVIHRLPQLRVLDFGKVRPQEREEAKQRFAGSGATAKAGAPGSPKAKSFEPPKTMAEIDEAAKRAQRTKPAGLSDAERAKIEKAIMEAKTMEEVAKLERQLKAGQPLS